MENGSNDYFSKKDETPDVKVPTLEAKAGKPENNNNQPLTPEQKKSAFTFLLEESD
jgi:hypothetical protein